MGPVLRELEQGGRLIRGELRPGRQRARVVRRRRAAPPAARVARVAAPRGGARRAARARAAAAGLAGRGLGARRRSRRRPAARAAGAAPGPGAGARGLGARRASAARRAATRPAWLDQLCAGGELVWVGAGLARAAARAGWRSTSATTCAGSGRRRSRATRRSEPMHVADPRAARSAARRSGPTCWPTWRRPSRWSSRRRSGTSSGRARSRTTRSRRCARRG